MTFCSGKKGFNALREEQLSSFPEGELPMLTGQVFGLDGVDEEQECGDISVISKHQKIFHYNLLVA